MSFDVAGAHERRGVVVRIEQSGLETVEGQFRRRFFMNPRGLSSWKLLPALVAQIFAKALRWRIDRRAEKPGRKFGLPVETAQQFPLF